MEYFVNRRKAFRGGGATAFISASTTTDHPLGTRSTYGFSPSKTYNAGDRLVILLGGNTGQTITSITDDTGAGNTWAVDVSEIGTTTVQQTAICSTVLQGSIGVSDTITFNWDNSVYQSLCTCEMALSNAGTVGITANTGPASYAATITATATVANDGIAAVLGTETSDTAYVSSTYTVVATSLKSGSFKSQRPGYGPTLAGSQSFAATMPSAVTHRVMWVNYSP
jgi:hypothetical protein